MPAETVNDAFFSISEILLLISTAVRQWQQPKDFNTNYQVSEDSVARAFATMGNPFDPDILPLVLTLWI